MLVSVFEELRMKSVMMVKSVLKPCLPMPSEVKMPRLRGGKERMTQEKRVVGEMSGIESWRNDT